jgi:hypothetical protein
MAEATRTTTLSSRRSRTSATPIAQERIPEVREGLVRIALKNDSHIAK